LPEDAVSRLLIRNGRVVDPSRDIDEGLDVLLDRGVVAEVGERVEAPAKTEVLDATGMVVAPGLIGLACHLREPGFEHKETIASGCRAAVAGGFTAVCCTPDTSPVNDDPAVTRFITERAEAVGLARVHPMGAVSRRLEGAELAEIGEMAREGAVAVSDGGRPVVSSLLLRRALEYARSFDLPVVVHAEDPGLSDGGVMHEGAVSTRIGLRAAPAAAEEIAVARGLVLARITGGRLHLSHVSCAGALDEVREAKRAGLDVTCDTSPQYFCLSDTDVAAATYHPNWKTDPPLRSVEDVEAVKQAIADGTVDAIATDHEPHHQDDKELDFSDAPAGVVGLETAVSLAIDRLVHGKVIGIGQLVRLLSTGPARAFGLAGGTLQPGAPADVTVLDLRRQVTVDPTTFRSKSRNTPFAGWKLRGAPVATIVGGRIVWQAER
jgi:dihydroorotase